MIEILTPCTLGRSQVPNRFLAQPLEHNQARDDGTFSDPLLAYYRKLRDGNWGVVVMETTAIHPAERCREHALVLSPGKENLASWTSFFAEMHGVGNGTRWIVEISAAGYKNLEGVARAAYPGQAEAPRAPAYNTAEIDALIDMYVQATRLAYEAGADGIDFKQCHGYFAGLLLRPANVREDEYGGSFENRTRFLTEYTSRARKAIGDRSFLFTTRVNAWDGSLPGGFGMAGCEGITAQVRDPSEPERLYALLSDLGYDLVNVSAGIPGIAGMVNSGAGIPPQFYTFQDLALAARSALATTGHGARVASTCWSGLGPRAITLGSAYIARGMDFIGFGRWQLAEPSLPRVTSAIVASGGDLEDDLGDRANVCLACGKCGGGLRGPGPVTCHVYP